MMIIIYHIITHYIDCVMLEWFNGADWRLDNIYKL